jgi:hypothetical protein
MEENKETTTKTTEIVEREDIPHWTPCVWFGEQAPNQDQWDELRHLGLHPGRSIILGPVVYKTMARGVVSHELAYDCLKTMANANETPCNILVCDRVVDFGKDLMHLRMWGRATNCEEGCGATFHEGWQRFPTILQWDENLSGFVKFEL